MRIVGGSYRGRRLAAPRGPDIRPTADRTRESLFNILVHGDYRAGGGSIVEDATVLDGFAGTGALGIEALSRGAAFATFVEHDRAALAAIRRNLAALGIDRAVDVVAGDATAPPPARRRHDLVMLDPPYGSGLGAPALAALAARHWLADDAIASIETAAEEDVAAPEGFAIVDARRYGAARVTLLRRSG